MRYNHSLSIYLLYFCSLSVNAEQIAIDRIVSVVYAPVIVIFPDENTGNFPSSLSVKLLINENGRVNEVRYSDITSETIKLKVANYWITWPPILVRGLPVTLTPDRPL